LFLLLFSKMGLLINSAPVLVILLAFVNCVAADGYYIGSSIGGVLGLVISILKVSFYFISKFSLF